MTHTYELPRLMPSDLVDFFSIYVKPNTMNCDSSRIKRDQSSNSDNLRKRHFEEGKCFSCGQSGHKQSCCSKMAKFESRALPYREVLTLQMIRRLYLCKLN